MLTGCQTHMESPRTRVEQLSGSSSWCRKRYAWFMSGIFGKERGRDLISAWWSLQRLPRLCELHLKEEQEFLGWARGQGEE